MKLINIYLIGHYIYVIYIISTSPIKYMPWNNEIISWGFGLLCMDAWCMLLDIEDIGTGNGYGVLWRNWGLYMVLLLFVEIRPFPLWKCVMFMTSVSDRCRIFFTRCASSSSMFRMILVLQLLMIPFPYLPSSRAKKSFKSCVAKMPAPE